MIARARWTIRLLGLLVAGVWVFVPLYFLRPLFSPGFFFSHEDLNYYNFAFRSWFFEVFANNDLTFLFPFNSLGISLAGNPQYSFYYPTNVLFLLLEPQNAYKVNHLLHHPLAGMGWFLALRALRFPRPAAVVAATVLVASGVMWSSCFRMEIQSTAWTGYVTWALVMSLRPNRGAAWAMLAGVFLGLVYLGANPDMVASTGLQAVMLATIGVVPRPSVRLPWKQLALHATLMVVVAFVVFFPVFFQGMLLVPFTVRAYAFDATHNLVYSMHPLRLLDLAAPWIRTWLGYTDEQVPAFMDLPRQYYWYPHLSIGVAATALLLTGAVALARRWFGVLYLLVTAVFLYLALGAFVVGGEDAWTQAPVLRYFRFPEKFFRHFFILTLPLVAMGYGVVEKAWQRHIRVPAWVMAMVVFGVTMVEATAYVPSPLVLPPGSLSSHPALVHMLQDPTAPGQLLPHRILLCTRGLTGQSAPADVDELERKMWRLGYLKNGENAEAPVVRALSCPWAIQKDVAEWMGISHVVSMDPEDEIHFTQRFPNLVLLAKHADLGFSFFRVEGASPAAAFFTPWSRTGHLIQGVHSAGPRTRAMNVEDGLKDLKRSTLLLDPDVYLDPSGLPVWSKPRSDAAGTSSPPPGQDTQGCKPEMVPVSLSAAQDVIYLDHDFPCAGVVSLPWAFIPGWRLVVNGTEAPLSRVGDTTLGFPVPQGPTHAIVRYHPPYLAPTFALSLAVILGVVVFVARSSRQRKQQPVV